MTTFQKKIETLTLEKTKIDEQIKALQRQHHEDLLQTLETLPLASLDLPTLTGGIQFVIQKASEDISQKEEWRQAGLIFCQKRRSQKARKASTTSQKTASEKE